MPEDGTCLLGIASTHRALKDGYTRHPWPETYNVHQLILHTMTVEYIDA